MFGRRLTLPIVLGLVFSMATGTGAGTVVTADPEQEGVISPTRHHHKLQHGEGQGHLPPTRRNVDLVGKLDLFGGEEQPGRISDVAVFGDYAYLGAFYQPECEDGGVYVVDISDPTNPTEAGFIPVTPGTYVGEGVQVLDMATQHFTGQVLLLNHENCVPGVGPLYGLGGASLWDVTDPTNPRPLAQHFGDLDPTAGSTPHATHSVFGWQQEGRAYMVTTDNNELGATDVDIYDITDPRSPVMVAETGMSDFPQIAEDPPPNGSLYLHHDMVVKKVGDRWLMLSSYWDGGYVILDVTGLPGEVRYLRDTDFGTEPFASQMGLPPDWLPEGNAHQAEFSHDDRWFLGADEDFNPFRTSGAVLGGRYAGDRYSATLGSDVPDVPEGGIQGGTEWVGLGCTPLPPARAPIALMERGTCTFTIKAQMAQLAGYEMGLVFNDAVTDAPNCEGQVFMLAVADIPFLFVSRSTGLKLLDQEFTNSCDTPTPPPLTPSVETMLSPIFDGWGYLHLYDAQTMQAVAHWALPESLDQSYARNFGDLSIHEVATDPKESLAYISHYAGGFRVVKFGPGGIREVGAFIDQGGNNFWGVEVAAHTATTKKGKKVRPLVLASDRDAGLYIFRYTGP